MTITYDLTTVQYDFQANTYTSGDQLAPDIVGLTNGGYAVAYNNFDINGGFILLDFYDKDGNVVGTVTEPYFGSTQAAGAPTITEMSNGNVVVIWDENSADSYGLKGAIYSPEGETVVPEFTVTTAPGDKLPQVAALQGEDGGFVVVNQHGTGNIYIEVFDENGVSQSAEIQIDGENATGSEPVVTGLADGGFVVTWTDSSTAETQLMARIFEADGTPREVNGSIDPFVVATGGDNSQPAITALPDGNWAIAYTDSGWINEDVGITLTIMGPNGQIVNAYEHANTPDDPDYSLAKSDPDITVLDNGYIVVSWSKVEIGVDPDHDTYVRIFDQDGDPVVEDSYSAEIPIGGYYDETQSAISAIQSGQFVAAWQDSRGDGSGDQITVTVKELVRTINGDGASQILNGDDIRDVIKGNGGADTMNGFGGNDTLDGGAGADAMTGGSGDDTYVVDNAGDTTAEAAGGGKDTVSTTITHTLAANVENLVLNGASAINGTGNDGINAISGNSAANVLSGLGQSDALNGYGGGDTLNGGTGADAMTGGNGDDTYVVDNAGDTTVEAAGGGTDLVQSTVGFTLAANVENLVLNGASAINGAGNASANAITGNSAGNVLSGLAENDTLSGFGGNDTLNGGTGADTMSGGNGDDTYVVDNAGDTASEASGSGGDLVKSTVSFTLAAGIETLVLDGAAAINGTGNASANTIYGNSAVNRLDGNGGADTLTGFGGADVFVFDDNDGADTVTDFQNGSDKCDLTQVAGVDAFSDLVLTDTGAGVEVDYGTGSFELANVANFAAIDAGDFIFA